MYLDYAYNTCVLYIIFVIPFALCTAASETSALAYLHLTKDGFHDPTTISLPRNVREFICSAEGSGQQVWIVDDLGDVDDEVDEDPSDFIHGVITRLYKPFTEMYLDGFIYAPGESISI